LEFCVDHRPVVDFWYDFASHYSWLAANRIEAKAEEAAVGIRWRPFLLGPIFAAQGWNSSPFILHQAKGRYAWRDIEREAARQGLGVVRPNPFPQNSLVAARVALAGREAGWTPAFSRALYAAEFVAGRSISDPATLTDVLSGLGLDAGAVLAAAQSEAVKGRLKAETEEARTRGVFGAPTFLTADGEMFWGNDRLEQALAWAIGERPGSVR
jgi:2-hydroxychromene-2-carboxylate isomerase